MGGDSSLWESSDHDDITGDESGDESTQFSGSLSDNNEEHVTDAGDGLMQVVNTESTDSCTEGDNEEPEPRYELRSWSKKQCKPHA